MKVVYKKLKRELAHGMCHDTHIEIDPRLEGKKHLEIFLHEMLHWWFPSLEEDDIVRVSADMCRAMWLDGYRRVDNREGDLLQDGKK